MVDGVFLNPSVIVVITHASVITYPPGETYTTNTIYIMHTHYHGYIDNDIFFFFYKSPQDEGAQHPESG